MQNVHQLFKKTVFYKGQWIVREDWPNHNVYLICTGECSLYKNLKKLIPKRNILNKNVLNMDENFQKKRKKHELKVLSIGKGEFVGENCIMGREVNANYSVQVESPVIEVLFISGHDFNKKFKKAIANI